MNYFLKTENLNQLHTLCYGFINDTQKINVSSNVISQLMQEIIKQISSQPGYAQMTLEELNKRTILGVRDRILSSRSNTPHIPPVPPSPISSKLEDDDSEQNPENEFFQKLQNLELQRKAPVASTNPVTPQPVSTPLILPQPQTQPQQPITVIVPSSTVGSYGITTHVNSRDRNWIFDNNIAIITWNGPLPKQMDESNFRIVSLVVPRCIENLTPYLIIRIEGVGGQVQHVTCISVSNSNSNPWIIYKPCSDTSGYIRRFALPWKISLVDAYGMIVNIGKDAWLVDQFDSKSITISHPDIKDVENMFCIKDRVLLKDGLGKKVSGIIRNISNGSKLEVKWDIEIDYSELQVPLYILHEYRQWSIILESHQTTHSGKK